MTSRKRDRYCKVKQEEEQRRRLENELCWLGEKCARQQQQVETSAAKWADHGEAWRIVQRDLQNERN